LDMFKNKKGISLTEVPTVIVLLVVIGIVLMLGQTILGNFKAQQCGNGNSSNVYWNETQQACMSGSAVWTATPYAHNITGEGQIGLDTFSGFQNTIAIVVVAGVILSIIFGVLVYNKFN